MTTEDIRIYVEIKLTSSITEAHTEIHPNGKRKAMKILSLNGWSHSRSSPF